VSIIDVAGFSGRAGARTPTPKRRSTVTVDLPGTENDAAVLTSAISFAAGEGAAVRILLTDRAADSFQDELHWALLTAVRRAGCRPQDIEVVQTGKSLG
jgi:hypothetical protein